MAYQQYDGDIQKEMAPLFSEYQSKITQNEKLFKHKVSLFLDVQTTKQ